MGQMSEGETVIYCSRGPLVTRQKSAKKIPTKNAELLTNKNRQNGENGMLNSAVFSALLSALFCRRCYVGAVLLALFVSAVLSALFCRRCFVGVPGPLTRTSLELEK